jgi:hypothetical protein
MSDGDITSTNHARRESYLMLGICVRVIFSVAEAPAVELFRNQPYSTKIATFRRKNEV